MSKERPQPPALTEESILRRMLSTRPEPHVQPKPKAKPAKAKPKPRK